MKQKGDRFGEHLSVVLKKMCDVVGVDFDTFNFDDQYWFLKNEWTKEEEVEFGKWLADYMRSTRGARNVLMRFPSIKKSNIQYFVNAFIFNYGWKVKLSDKNENTKDKTA